MYIYVYMYISMYASFIHSFIHCLCYFGSFSGSFDFGNSNSGPLIFKACMQICQDVLVCFVFSYTFYTVP